MHLNSELLFKKHYGSFFKPGMKVLEIGPSGIPSAYSRIVNDHTIQWDTIDFENTIYINSSTSKLTYIIENPYSFPVADETYDVILSGQVIEHVQEIWKWMAELKRVVKSKGIIFTISPVSWPFHEAPLDCWRIFPSGIEAIANFCKLEVVLCLFESEEKNQLQEKDKNIITVPGKSYNYSNRPSKVNRILKWNRLLDFFPIAMHDLKVPIEVSYDTISVLRKP